MTTTLSQIFPDVFAVGVEIVVKVTLLLLLAWLASTALRRASAAVRHLLEPPVTKRCGWFWTPIQKLRESPIQRRIEICRPFVLSAWRKIQALVIRQLWR